MAVTRRSLHLPPYISTSWKNVLSLHMEQDENGPVLVVTLVNGAQILIPTLEEPIVRQIFAIHSKVLEQDGPQSPDSPASQQDISAEGIFSLDPGDFSMMMDHNAAQADAPPLPHELLGRIRQLSNLMGNEFVSTLPHPEPGCNCCHCQVHRALHHHETESRASEAAAPPKWLVENHGQGPLYRVTNSCDGHEHYDVTLGDTVACSCGNPGCEHIRAVLMS